MPSPIIIPSDSASKGLTFCCFEKAGVLLKDIYIKIELSVSTPPVIIISARYSRRSLTAIFKAESEAAQAASTTQLVPLKFRRLAIRPAMTLPNIPGKEFSSQPTKPSLIFSLIFCVSSSDSPLLLRTFSQIGYCNLVARGVINFCPPPTPKMTPVRERIDSLPSPYPASSIAALATTRASSWETSVTSRMLGGNPNASGSKSICGINPPRLQ